MKIGITGSLASGKTTASKILSFKRGPLFSADNVVKKIYSTNKLKKVISKKLKVKDLRNIKKEIINKILINKSYIKKLEQIIQPIVREEMYKFSKKHKMKKFVFFEIPLLIESKLMKKFDIIFFIKAKKSLRKRRFKLKGGNKKLFEILDKRQLSANKKIKFCDHIIINNKNLNVLKKSLSVIIKNYV